jgi:hypothetical protein
MGILKRAVIGIAILLALIVAGDVLVRNFVSNKIEAGLASSLELSGRPDVTIGGFPFVLQAVRGRLDEVSISADTLRGQSVKLSDVSLVLEDVRFSLGDLLSGKGTASIGSGHGSAVITRAAVIDALEGQGIDPLLAEQPIPSDAIRLTAERTLALGPTEIQLPLMSSAMSYDDIDIDGDRITLRFSIAKTKIEIDR